MSSRLMPRVEVHFSTLTPRKETVVWKRLRRALSQQVDGRGLLSPLTLFAREKAPGQAGKRGEGP